MDVKKYLTLEKDKILSKCEIQNNDRVYITEEEYKQYKKDGKFVLHEFDESTQNNKFFSLKVYSDNAEFNQFIALEQLKTLKIIKSCALYFTIISIISLIGGFIGLLVLLSAK